VRGACALVFAFFLLLTSQLALGAGRVVSSPRRAGVVQDTGGTIAEVVIHYLSSMDAELEPVYLDLFAALGPGVHLQVLCPSEEDADLFEATWEDLAALNGRDVCVVDVDRPLTIWPRDRRIARCRPDTGQPVSCFVPIRNAQYESDKLNELDLIGGLSDVGLSPRQMSPLLYLEGGNVVANARHAFIGANVLEDNPEAGRAELIERRLRQIVGIEPVLVQDDAGQVPWCHTDMYLTPVDDRTILVADPRLGLEIVLGTEGRGHLDELPRCVADEVDHNVSRLEMYDQIARRLERLGYQVIRMPALIGRDEQWMVTYNNVLQDRAGRQRVVMMPVYQIPVLDAAAAEIYERLGYEVRPIDVSTIYDLGGAVRCMVNVTQRQPLDPPAQVAPAPRPRAAHSDNISTRPAASARRLLARRPRDATETPSTPVQGVKTQ
jgi:N-dimethylarginine dimethylaminohydrolase